jgi:hypothetical protein
MMPYTVCIYWFFRGEVKLDRMSYQDKTEGRNPNSERNPKL